jgi:hypothetical protein
MKYDMAKIIHSITLVMPCESCPYPCESKDHSSRANCNRHWFLILSNMEMHPWEMVHDILFEIFVNSEVSNDD